MTNNYSNWTFKGKTVKNIEDMQIHEPKVWGFVYLMSLYDIKTGELKYRYIGKKNIYSKRKRSFGKKEVASMKDKRGKKYEYVIKESDWKTYLSSNSFIKDNANKYKIKREILMFSTNDMDLKYKEAKEIICRGCLEDDFFLNDGASLRVFGKKVM